MIGSIHDQESTIVPEIAEAITFEIETRCRKNLASFIATYLSQNRYGKNWDVRDIHDLKSPFVSSVSNLIYRNLTPQFLTNPEPLTDSPELFSVLAVLRPDLTRAWCLQSQPFTSYKLRAVWRMIIQASDAYDDLCIQYCGKAKDDAFLILNELNQERNGAYFQKMIEAASIPESSLGHDALEVLLKHRNANVIPLMIHAFALQNAGNYTSMIDGVAYQELYKLIIARWREGGEILLLNLVANSRTEHLNDILTKNLLKLGPEHFPTFREGFLRQLERRDASERADLWRMLVTTYPEACEADFKSMMSGKSKPLRGIAAGALVKIGGNRYLDEVIPLLASKKADARHGAALFFSELADPSTLPILREALETEESDAVRLLFHQTISSLGGSSPVATGNNLADLEALVAKAAKSTTLPKIDWLDFATLPALSPLSTPAVHFLIARQSKHRTIDAAPDIQPFLPLIDRSKSSAFATHLLEAFLNSPQAASDRWALALAGLLGSSEIIPPLLRRIPDWCENSRHKLAEYAAQAISLLPGNEPLTVLDTLANRYRNKFKNVGAACSAAFGAAATARGITPDELADLVVPDFGFDEDGIRKLEWPGGSVHVELTSDFRFEWFDPETEKSWKALPSSAPAELQSEMKNLMKLLRETIKGQTARLELTLVRQRRWPVERWRKLFEKHPLLRSFASRLIWGVYNGSELTRTFRRYQNGLLADAGGNLEELPETTTSIGMVHPLELADDTLAAWRSHLGRFKVKPPFPQLERPVVLLDPLHGNRREIPTSRGKELSAGTFRSRAEKRGWVRGAVVDAGGISSYFKPYPGAGVEVILPLDNFYIGIDPMDTVTLEAAYFVKAATVERGSYTYDEPTADDPRVLPFSGVSAVVYSETNSDLRAIIGEIDS